VLPQSFAANPERVARFEREAKTLASLNHPNIGQIYGIEDGPAALDSARAGEAGHYVRALVLELVEGPTLADRIARGAIPMDEALPITRQIAEALEAAHELGIVHRDLKPANIKLRPDGVVKVLDFGLAKALDPGPTAIDASQSPTITSPAMTRMGVILGTAAYMSPEQARGKVVDKRADIWAFGCVLYEMLAGRRAFKAESMTDIVVSVITKEPDWSALPDETPGNVRKLLRRCLEKDSKRRLRDIGDARVEIEETLSEPRATPAARLASRSSRWAGAIPWAIAALVTVVASISFIGRSREPSPTAAPVRLVLTLPEDQRLWLGSLYGHWPGVAISPDGARLVYVASQGETTQLYLREIDSFEAKSIAGTEGGFNPFFSPDGQWLGFFTSRELRKVSLSGGAPERISEVSPVTRGGTWGRDDSILFVDGETAGIVRVPAGGGARRTVTTVRFRDGERSHRWPELLPDGKAVLFTVYTAREGKAGTTDIAVQSLETGERRIVARDGSNPRYVPTGHLVYASGGGLLAVPFDVSQLSVIGRPVPIVDGVSMHPEDAAHFAVSQNGALIYVPGRVEDEPRSLVWVDRRGGMERLPTPPRSYGSPALSPDGLQIALNITSGIATDTWTYDVTRALLSRLTFDWTVYPTWTPDGRRLVFMAVVPRAPTPNLAYEFVWSLFWQPLDSGAGPERLVAKDAIVFTGSWSADGRTLVFPEWEAPRNQMDLWTLSLDGGDGTARPFLTSPFDEIQPAFSPESPWIAYVSNESGRYEIYVRGAPGQEGSRRQVSADGGTEPRWARNGRELFYRNGDKMMAVGISTQPTFQAATPRVLFEGHYWAGGTRPGYPQYDITPDGQRFIMISEPGQRAAPMRLNVVLNWSEELKQRVPANK
jgi:serine/threonine-protein kinase